MTRRFKRTMEYLSELKSSGVRVFIGRSLPDDTGAADGDALLVRADANHENGRVEELVDDVVLLSESVVHQRRVAGPRVGEKRGRFRHAHRLRHLDVHVRAVV